MLGCKFFSMKMISFSTAYFLLVMVINIIEASRKTSNSLFDYILNLRWGGSADILVLSVGILPVLALVIPMVMDRMESSMIITRMEHKGKLLSYYVLPAFYISIFFTLLMAAGGIVAALIDTGHIHNLWGSEKGMIYFLLDNKSHFPIYVPHVTSLKVWGYILSSRFMAILFMSMCIIFLKLVLRKNMYVFFVSLIVIGSDSLFLNRFSLFTGRVRITMDTWLSLGDQLFNLVYFLLGITILYYLCQILYQKKDFYS